MKKLATVTCCAPGAPPLRAEGVRETSRRASRRSPTRRRLAIVNRLASTGDACVCEFNSLGLSQPTISHHLRVLREAGLIEVSHKREDLGLLPARSRGCRGARLRARRCAAAGARARHRGGHRCPLRRSSSSASGTRAARRWRRRSPSEPGSRSGRPALAPRPTSIPRWSRRCASSASTSSGRVPHQLADEDVEWADLVVTMGCGDACPVLPGKRYLDWNLQDPVGMPIEVVREIRDGSPVSSTSCASSPAPAASRRPRRAGSRGRAPRPRPCARPARRGASRPRAGARRGLRPRAARRAPRSGAARDGRARAAAPPRSV